MRLPIPISILLAALAAPLPALAQQPVVTSPGQVTPTVAATLTIGTGGGTFQSVFAAAGNATSPASKPRQGCLIEDVGSHNQWVFFGPIANATEAKSVLIVPVGSAGPNGVSCATSAGGVLQDQISITGTSADTFFASVQ